MKKIATYLTIVIFGIITLNAQNIELSGTQSTSNDSNSPKLSCTPVKVTSTMKISSVEGNCNGFWIQRGSETIHKFTNLTDPIGTKLKPGIYYIYPNIKEGKKIADITITLKSDNS